MIIAIHQPNFIPWIGYFFKISKCDVFVLLDNVQYTKNGFINRNRIKTPQGENWLTLPVVQSGKFGQDIKETQIFNKDYSVKKVLATIAANYKKAAYFDKYYTGITEILNKSSDNLCDVNSILIKWAAADLGIKTKMIFASELDEITGESTERLVSICKKLNGTSYLAGLGAKKYQEDHLFKAVNINVINTPFKHPGYQQLWGDFLPNMSVIDLLFNCGPEAKTILNNSM
jgi:hypothetical protein